MTPLFEIDARTRLPWHQSSPLPLIRTAVTDEEAAELARLAAGLRVCEIGACYGFSAIAMALGGAEHVTSIDPHLSHPDNDCRPDTLTVMQANLAAYGVADRVTIICEPSPDALAGLVGGFGLIVIDGDHSCEAVAADIKAALPLLAADGVLACHGYDSAGNPGVREAVDQTFPAGPDRLAVTLFIIKAPRKDCR